MTQQEVENVDDSVEGLGRADSIVGDLGTEGLTGRLAARADEGLTRAATASGPELDDGDPDPVVVLGSGNLGLLYVRGPRRLTLDDLGRHWPRLIPGLLEHPGIGFVGGVDDSGVPWAIGATGRRNLTSGLVAGTDPLQPFGPHAARTLCRAVLLAEAPDLYVNSAIDPVTNDVNAFEGLVGSHGGLGGWQDQAMLLAPADLMATVPSRIEGADALHDALVGMLEQCGQRAAASRDR